MTVQAHTTKGVDPSINSTDSKAKRVALVTGASGFVGSRLAHYLSENGWEVHGLLRPESKIPPLLEGSAVGLHRFTPDLESIVPIFQKLKPAVVFHLASLFTAERKSQDVIPLIQSNVLFGALILEAMAVTGTSLIVNVGTQTQHDKEGNYAPWNLYAATKMAFQDIVQFYTDSGVIRAITLKLFDTYGPGDPRGKIVSLLVKSQREGRVLELSPGEQKIDLVHIADVVKAFEVAAINLLENPEIPHQEYGVFSGNPISIKQLAALIGDLGGRPLQANFGALPYRRRERMESWQTARRLPGWEPAISLAKGLKDLLQNPLALAILVAERADLFEAVAF